jgi:hypothetical protein
MGVAHEALTPAAVEVISDALDLAREESEPMRPRLVAVPDPQTVILERDTHGDQQPLVDVTVVHQETTVFHDRHVVDDHIIEDTVTVEEVVTIREEVTEIPVISTPAGSEPDQAPPKTPSPKAKGRRGRAAMPSWDEILFGTTRTEE